MTDTDDMIVMEEGDVVITAASELVDSSYRAGEEFLWGYYFCIENNSDEKITLLGKNWNITDDSGRSFCDDSDGFSGEIPSWNLANISSSAPPRRSRPLMRFSTAAAKS